MPYSNGYETVPVSYKFTCDRCDGAIVCQGAVPWDAIPDDWMRVKIKGRGSKGNLDYDGEYLLCDQCSRLFADAFIKFSMKCWSLGLIKKETSNE